MFGLWRRKPTLDLRSANLRLRYPCKKDFAQWRASRIKSHQFLKPFEPSSSLSGLTKDNFAQRVHRTQRAANRGHEHVFFLFDSSSGNDVLIGGLTLSNVRFRAARHANLGYWMHVDYANRGYMSKAMTLCLNFAFFELKLQRVHAACLPHNVASRRVLEKSGFAEEGFAANYLQIDGRWQDHVLYGLTKRVYEGLDVQNSTQTASHEQ